VRRNFEKASRRSWAPVGSAQHLLFGLESVKEKFIEQNDFADLSDRQEGEFWNERPDLTKDVQHLTEHLKLDDHGLLVRIPLL
jgi:hypothetical protein